jgi:hypothetical protein
MTERDPGDGFFDHLDDGAAPVPGRETLDSVLLRGRHIRTRRHTLFAASGVLTATALALGGFGISHAVNADHSHDSIVPIHSPSASASPNLTPSPSPRVDHTLLAGGGVPRRSPQVPGSTPAPPSPSTTPCGAGSTASPSSGPSLAPTLAPAPGDTPSPESSPTPSPSLTPPVSCPSQPPSPAPTASPDETPSPVATPSS